MNDLDIDPIKRRIHLITKEGHYYALDMDTGEIIVNDQQVEGWYITAIPGADYLITGKGTTWTDFYHYEFDALEQLVLTHEKRYQKNLNLSASRGISLHPSKAFYTFLLKRSGFNQDELVRIDSKDPNQVLNRTFIDERTSYIFQSENYLFVPQDYHLENDFIRVYDPRTFEIKFNLPIDSADDTHFYTTNRTEDILIVARGNHIYRYELPQ